MVKFLKALFAKKAEVLYRPMDREAINRMVAASMRDQREDDVAARRLRNSHRFGNDN